MLTTTSPYLHNTSLLQQYFPLTHTQCTQLHQLGEAYATWNQHINLISRKDLPNLYTHHILHSLSIAKIIQLQPNAHILDLGTGGGLPGLPLAIYFPKTHFTLIDGTKKKIKAVQAIAQKLQLHNLQALHLRAENLTQTYDFIVSRAVAPLHKLHQWTKNNIKPHNNHPIPNGLLCLKGGDLHSELATLNLQHTTYHLNTLFKEPFFQTKKLIHLFNHTHN